LRKELGDPPIAVVENDPQQIARHLPPGISVINQDAVSFLVQSSVIAPQDVIIPMVPFHLAARFVVRRTAHCTESALPKQLSSMVPNPFIVDEANMCCSRADFICPDDCPEGERCTVTGIPRIPLYQDLADLKLPGFTVLVQRSFQVLPGVGGFHFRDLCSIQEHVRSGTYIVATSCKCHAMMTGLERRTLTSHASSISKT
jgi:hypothetical protein